MTSRENKFYLIGNVALSQGENVTRGDKLIYDLATGQAVVTSKGRVHSLIIPRTIKPAAGAPAAAKPQTTPKKPPPKTPAPAMSLH